MCSLSDSVARAATLRGAVKDSGVARVDPGVSNMPASDITIPASKASFVIDGLHPPDGPAAAIHPANLSWEVEPI